MKRMPLKAVLSTLLLLIFLFLAFSGALLYFGKTGMVLGIPRGALRSAHTLVAAVMCIFVAAHFVLNFRIYLTELRALRKRGTDDPKAEAEREKRK